PGETVTLDLGRIDTLRAVQVNFADYKSGRFADAPDIYTEFVLEASADGQHWQEIARTEPPRRDRPNAYFELPQPVRARFVRYVHGHVGAADLAIADIRVFGNADDPAPGPPAYLSAARHADGRDAAHIPPDEVVAIVRRLEQDRSLIDAEIILRHPAALRIDRAGVQLNAGVGEARVEAVLEAVGIEQLRLVHQRLRGRDHDLR